MSHAIFKNDAAYIKLKQLDNKTACVVNLFSYDRGKGHARDVLQQAIDFADSFGIQLVTKAKRYHDGDGLTDDELVIFYEKFGFVRQGRAIADKKWVLIREPKDRIAE